MSCNSAQLVEAEADISISAATAWAADNHRAESERPKDEEGQREGAFGGQYGWVDDVS